MNCIMNPLNQKWTILTGWWSVFQFESADILVQSYYTPAQTRADTHNVLKFRQQLCRCTKQTDGQTDCQPHCVSVCARLLVFISYSYIYILLVYLLLPSAVQPWQASGKSALRYLCENEGGREQEARKREEDRTSRVFHSIHMIFFSLSLFQKLVSLTGESVWEEGWWKRWREKGGLRSRKIEKLSERKL